MNNKLFLQSYAAEQWNECINIAINCLSGVYYQCK